MSQDYFGVLLFTWNFSSEQWFVWPVSTSNVWLFYLLGDSEGDENYTRLGWYEKRPRARDILRYYRVPISKLFVIYNQPVSCRETKVHIGSLCLVMYMGIKTGNDQDVTTWNSWIRIFSPTVLRPNGRSNANKCLTVTHQIAGVLKGIEQNDQIEVWWREA